MQVSTAITVNIMTILLPLVRTLTTALASGYAYGFVAGVVIWVIWQLAGVREAAQTAFAVGSTGVMLVGIPYGLATGLGGLFRPRSSPRYADIGLQGRWGLLVRVLRARLASGIRNRVLIVWVPKPRTTSCDLGILVDQPSEAIQPHDPCAGRWSRRCDGSSGGT